MPLRQAGRTLHCLDHTRPVYGIMIGGVCFCCGQSNYRQRNVPPTNRHSAAASSDDVAAQDYAAARSPACKMASMLGEQERQQVTCSMASSRFQPCFWTR